VVVGTRVIVGTWDHDAVTARPDPEAGVLVLAATPIGRVEDASPRLAVELGTADVVAAEDTRRLRRLAAALGIEVTGSLVSYLVTDAGMPTVSDPGYRIVRAAVEAGVAVTAVPGPSAVLTALAVSGLPVDRFCFEGFLPRKAGERARRLDGLAGEPRTMVFFEAPHRAAATLAALADAFGGDRVAACCRELTKTHEEVRRGALSELVEWAEPGLRGEVTIVVAGAERVPVAAAPEGLAAEVLARERAGIARKEAIAAVAQRAGVPKRVVYDAVHRPSSTP
jgi:16S rRNA (cytidine1402-2'-O)-methyltransferase